MTNIRYLLIIILCAGVGLYVRAQERPNIVLILADDIGTDDLGCYGNPFVQTPHIDRIAAEGLRFTNAYVTTSSCSPSRCSMLSGRYPHNTGEAELHTPHTAQIHIGRASCRERC